MNDNGLILDGSGPQSGFPSLDLNFKSLLLTPYIWLKTGTVGAALNQQVQISTSKLKCDHDPKQKYNIGMSHPYMKTKF